jgi:hypothetical protein
MSEPRFPDQQADPNESASPAPAPDSAPAADSAPSAPAAPGPAVAATPPAVAALQSSWQGFGQAERLAAAGGIVVVVAYLLGMIVDRWSLGITGLGLVVGSIIAVAAVFVAAGTGGWRLPGSPSFVIRTAAAVVGVFALMDFALLVTDFDQYEALPLILWAAYVVGAFVLVWGAWSATGGNLATDMTGVAGLMSRPLADRLVYGGAILLLVGWFLVLLIAQIFNFTDDPAVSVLFATLVLAVIWSARDAAAAVRWPIAANYLVAALAVVSALFALIWLSRVIGRIGDAGDLTVYGTLAIYVLGAVAMVAGALLSLQGSLASGPAAADAGSGAGTDGPGGATS